MWLREQEALLCAEQCSGCVSVPAWMLQTTEASSSQMRKRSHRRAESLVQDHTAGKQPNWDSDSPSGPRDHVIPLCYILTIKPLVAPLNIYVLELLLTALSSFYHLTAK